MSAFHDNQILSADEIIAGLTETPFLVLLAQMQSGKTGAYLQVGFKMLQKRLVKKVVIICGSSDKSLRHQAKEALSEGQNEFIDDLVDIPREEKREIRELFKGVEVFFSQDLKKTSIIGEETLIIHDESHMAQSKDNRPFKDFYLRNDLNGALTGNFDELRRKKIFVLGVSATPFSEIVANRKFLPAIGRRKKVHSSITSTFKQSRSTS